MNGIKVIWRKAGRAILALNYRQLLLIQATASVLLITGAYGAVALLCVMSRLWGMALFFLACAAVAGHFAYKLTRKTISGIKISE